MNLKITAFYLMSKESLTECQPSNETSDT